MIVMLKLVGAAMVGALLLAALAVYDLGWNGSALFYRVVGRDSLVEACTRPLRENLVGRGFSPVDLDFGASPSIASASGPFGRSKTLSGSFTFSDGHNGPRVDGRIACTVSGPAVEVDVEVETLPRRVT